MAEFDLKDLEKISDSQEILDLLIEKNIIKEKKFKKQLAYQKDLDKLQSELLSLQRHIVKENKRLLVIFEGRDAAGKGGTIKRMIAKLNPKKYRIMALPKPTEMETKQWYFQRFFKHLPHKGEVVFFDRSWYNRAVVEPVFGFCTKEEHESFMHQVNEVEQLLIDDGIILVKLFLSISKKEQEKRLESRKSNPEKSWKLGGLDEQAIEKWDDYSFYIDKMLKNTSKPNNPWVEIITDSKKTARIQSMKYVLGKIKLSEGKHSNVKYGSEIVKIHS